MRLGGAKKGQYQTIGVSTENWWTQNGLCESERESKTFLNIKASVHFLLKIWKITKQWLFPIYFDFSFGTRSICVLIVQMSEKRSFL